MSHPRSQALNRNFAVQLKGGYSLAGAVLRSRHDYLSEGCSSSSLASREGDKIRRAPERLAGAGAHARPKRESSSSQGEGRSVFERYATRKFKWSKLTILKSTKYKTESSWLNARRKLVTSSDAPIIAGLFEKGGFAPDRFTLWCQKTKKISGRISGLRLEVGRYLEEFIAQKVSEQMDLSLKDPGRFTIVKGAEDWIGATVDRVISDSKGNGTGILEIKTVTSVRRASWSEAPDLYTRLQMLHQLAVTGLSEPLLAAGMIGLGDELYIHPVEFSDDMIDALKEAEFKFWQHVQRDIPPPIGLGETSKNTLLELFPQHREDMVVSIDPSYENLQIALGWQHRKAQEKKLNVALREVRKELVANENQIKVQMGDAERADLGGAVGFSWKSSTRKGYTVEPKTIRTFREVK